MTAIKESSTIQENKQYALDTCPVTYVMEKIGGYWKPIILYHLSTGDKRYSELKRAIPAVTEKMLIQCTVAHLAIGPGISEPSKRVPVSVGLF